ncbi:MAG: glycosyltransferase, partial [Deltaproteobacteria bacterium]|nr:glycosyltransferase [Deltaproteobacteria bacterium]
MKFVIVSSDNPFMQVKVGGKHIHIANFYNAIKNDGIETEVITFDKEININVKSPSLFFSYFLSRLFKGKKNSNNKRKNANFRSLFSKKVLDKELLSHYMQKHVNYDVSLQESKNLRFLFRVKAIENELRDKILEMLKKENRENLYFIAEDTIAINALYRAGIHKEHIFAVIHGYFTHEALNYQSLIKNEHDLKFLFEYEKKAYFYCSKIVAVDSAIRDYIVKEIGVPKQNVKEIYNAIDYKPLDVNRERKQHFKEEFFKSQN